MNEGFALHARIYTRKSYPDPADGEALLGALSAHLPIARFGATEPLREDYGPDRTPDAAGLLASRFTLLLRGAKPRWDGYIAWEPRRTRPWFWTFDFAEAWLKKPDAVEAAMIAASIAGEAVFAGVALTADWIARHEAPNASGYAQRAGANFDVGSGLPGIYWLTVFGPALIRHFGHDALLALPAADVRHDDADGLALRVYPAPDSDDPETRRARTQAWIDQLGAEYFFDPAQIAAKRPRRRTPIGDVTDARSLRG